MATVGKSIYAPAIHTFFDALRSYDVEAACAPLANDAMLRSSWGNADDKAGIQAIFAKVFEAGMDRPSLTISDISGDGNVITLRVSVSGRFGKGAKIEAWRILHLKGKIHQILMV